jgi:hypothetical protein
VDIQGEDRRQRKKPRDGIVDLDYFSGSTLRGSQTIVFALSTSAAAASLFASDFEVHVNESGRTAVADEAQQPPVA